VKKLADTYWSLPAANERAVRIVKAFADLQIAGQQRQSELSRALSKAA
jgi:hypothetical protein